jgi:PTH1 family peptidyl-tRNA hydrolase
MKLIVGLGNPGAQYTHHRHNIGFMVVDAIAAQYGFPSFSNKGNALVATGKIGTEAAILVKPQTYMNLSGQAVQPLMAFYKIAPEDIWVIHDELEIEAGRVRLKQGGGHGGHNGLKDIDGRIGANYHRVRVGIGRPEHKGMVSNYVLSNFSAQEMEMQHHVIAGLADGISAILSGQGDKTLNQIAVKIQALKPVPEKTKKTAETENTKEI